VDIERLSAIFRACRGPVLASGEIAMGSGRTENPMPKRMHETNACGCHPRIHSERRVTRGVDERGSARQLIPSLLDEGASPFEAPARFAWDVRSGGSPRETGAHLDLALTQRRKQAMPQEWDATVLLYREAALLEFVP
jgi:hypothetical protein